jgi:2-oxoglutarate ferredoxin oxidoreductase subunit gamma
VPTLRALGVPISDLAEEATGRRITASIVSLGLIAGLTGLVSREALEKAVLDRVPSGSEEMNLQALAVGFAQAERLLGAAE